MTTRTKDTLMSLGFVLLAVLLFALFKLHPSDALPAAAYGAILITAIVWLRHLLRPFAVATLVAFLWMLIGADQYRYSWQTTIGGITLFPFFAWSLGLTGIYAVHFYLFRRRSFWASAALFCLLFWIGLLGFETIAYHALGLRNQGGIGHPGLPLCDCIHAPVWMQTIYLLLGPVFYALLTLWNRAKAPAPTAAGRAAAEPASEGGQQAVR